MYASHSSLRMPLRIICRHYGSSKKMIELTVDEKTGISTISMAKPPVNSLNLEMLDALRMSITEAQQNRVTGIILTSSLPTIFSAGLDIAEMYKPDMKRAREFWLSLQETWLTLYGLPIPVAAAINGASPAGGCLLAMSCEYRTMVEGKHRIGLNETKLGIIAPKWFRDLLIATVGYRRAEIALLQGSLFKPEQAIKIGLLDDLASDKASAIEKCKEYISSFAAIPAAARGITKAELRKPQLTWLKENREADVNEFLTYIQTPKVQAGIDLYMQLLKQKQ